MKPRYLFILATAFDMFDLIISLCKNSTTFNFGDMLFSQKRVVSLLSIKPTINTSSTLTKLQIIVESFFDLVHILDGRFDAKSTQLEISVSFTSNVQQ